MLFEYSHFNNVTAKCLLRHIARRREMNQHGEGANNCQGDRAPPGIEKCGVDPSPRFRFQRSCQDQPHHETYGQSANVGGIVNPCMGESIHQVEGDKYYPASTLLTYN